MPSISFLIRFISFVGTGNDVQEFRFRTSVSASRGYADIVADVQSEERERRILQNFCGEALAYATPAMSD